MYTKEVVHEGAGLLFFDAVQLNTQSCCTVAQGEESSAEPYLLNIPCYCSYPLHLCTNSLPSAKHKLCTMVQRWVCDVY